MAWLLSCLLSGNDRLCARLAWEGWRAAVVFYWWERRLGAGSEHTWAQLVLEVEEGRRAMLTKLCWTWGDRFRLQPLKKKKKKSWPRAWEVLGSWVRCSICFAVKLGRARMGRGGVGPWIRERGDGAPGTELGFGREACCNC